jgi:hypothetical protein
VSNFRTDGDIGAMKVEDFKAKVKNEIDNYAK